LQTWTFRNSGVTTWPADSRLMFIDGHQIGGPQTVPFVLEPGQEAPVPVNFKTPAEAGTYAGCWRMQCSLGYFGEPIWVVLNVRDDEGDALTDALGSWGLAAPAAGAAGAAPAPPAAAPGAPPASDASMQ
jgi:hypothetical protein